ncbi:MAG: hypothetical protein RLZZ305_715 [Actinomycetota bacterium]|jgi:hypothetical protein
MSSIEFCPECGGVVVGSGLDQRCTTCGLTYEEMSDLLDGDDELSEDDALDGYGDDSEDSEDSENFDLDLEEESGGDW